MNNITIEDTLDVTIDRQRATVIYAALGQAIEQTLERLTLKSAQPYKSALTMQVSAYKSERVRLAEAFPDLGKAVDELPF